MPHAIVRGGPSPRELLDEFQSWKETTAEGSVIEARCIFLRQDETVLLIQTTTVELGPAQHFFVAVEEKREQLSIRIYPHPVPTRTPAVQQAVTKVARWVLEFGGEVEKTNLVLS